LHTLSAITRVLAAAVVLGVANACATPPGSGAPPRPTQSASASACGEQGDESPAVVGEDRAVLCAEEYVRRNGLTDPTLRTDSMSVAREALEWTSSDERVVRHQWTVLRPNAYGICPGPAPHAYTVVFRYVPRAVAGRIEDSPRFTKGRAVTVDSSFRKLRVQQRDFVLAAVDQSRDGCRRLGAS